MEPRAGSHPVPTVMWQWKIYHIDDVARNTVVTFKRIHPNFGQIYDIGKYCHPASHLQRSLHGRKVNCIKHHSFLVTIAPDLKISTLIRRCDRGRMCFHS